MGGSSTSVTTPWAPQGDYLQGAYRDISKLMQVNPASGKYAGFRPGDLAGYAPNFIVPGQRLSPAQFQQFKEEGIIDPSQFSYYDGWGKNNWYTAKNNAKQFDLPGRLYTQPGAPQQQGTGVMYNYFPPGNPPDQPPGNYSGGLQGPAQVVQDGGPTYSVGIYDAPAYQAFGASPMSAGGTAYNESWGQGSFLPSWYGSEPAMRLAAGGPQPYAFDRVADFSPETEMGLQFGTMRALQGSPVMGAANQNLMNTLQGNYLSPYANPFLNATFNQMADQVSSRVNQQASQLGRSGSGAHLGTLSRELGGLANEIYGQNYQSERDRQLQSLGMAPQFAEQDYADVDRLLGFGAQRQGQAQQELGALMDLYSEREQLPYQNVSNFLNLISSGNWGGTTKTKTNPGALGIFTGIAGGLGSLGQGAGSAMSGYADLMGK